jgi:hypothetical protein
VPCPQDFFSGDFEYILNMVDVLNETATHDPRMLQPVATRRAF